jgi:FemAB-related protein (PEP-CTERM system-associated)
MDNAEIGHVKWDDFVAYCSLGTFFHLSGWKQVIEQTYGHSCWFMCALLQDDIVAVLPLVEINSRLFGHALVSTPFCVIGGVASDDKDAMLFLEDAAIQLADRLKVGHLELRYGFARDNPKLLNNCQHSGFVWTMPGSEQEVLPLVKKKQRAAIRHSLTSQLTSRVDVDIDVAYEIYSKSLRNLGTPVFPKAFFRQLKSVFAEHLDVLTVEHQGDAVSSVLSFYYKGSVMPYYGGGTQDARMLKSNDFMYYQLICHGLKNRGCQRFDFGRSKDDSGAYQYKKSWGITPVKMHYCYYLARAKHLPNLSHNNPKYVFLIALWKKLPVSISRIVGPYLAKYLG